MALGLTAQQIVDYGNVDENSRKSLQIKVAGPDNIFTGDSVWVYAKLVLNKPYGEGYYALSDSDKVAPSGDSAVFNFEFAPKQNMNAGGALIVQTKTECLEVVTLKGQGTFSNTYYSSTRNKTDEDLKSALKSLLANNYNSLGYNTARDNMYGSIDNDNGEVECVYTGTRARFNDRPGANANGFNCEHTFPQGFFSSADPMKSDIHHLFPTTTTSNSRRGNDPFGTVSNPSWQQGGSKSGGGKFEPRDKHKGTAARAMSYFVTRYQDYSSFYNGQEGILRQWMKQFPPSTQDSLRNEDIYKLQNNRNPYVDYPQFLDRISVLAGGSAVPTVVEMVWNDGLDQQKPDTSIQQSYTHVLYNSGNTDIQIDSIYLKDGLGFEVWRMGPFTNITLKPKESYELVVEINTVDGGLMSFEDSIIVKTSTAKYGRLAFPFYGWVNTGSSVLEYGSLNQLKVYPNPTSGVVYFSDLPKTAKELVVYDLSGALLKRQSSTNELDLSELTSGTYLLKVFDQNGAEIGLSRIVLK